MEPNGLNGGMFPGMSSGLLGGIENPLQQNVPNPQSQNPHSIHHHHHPQMVPYDTDIPQPQPIRQVHGYPYLDKTKQQSALSDEDEVAADDVSSGDPKSGKKMSPWHRMKWTDTMVKLLIMAVFYIGDEGGSEGGDNNNNKKPMMGLLQQKKGKWKSVSRAMMEKGFFVSPQQCEDKFNDLNKRYKRVNDILGKGTACLVVENNNLLDTMDLSPKMKEEVRKLLNSKHLFFKEMCAYHNSCGHGSTSGPQTELSPTQQQQKCSHASEIVVGNLSKPEAERVRILKGEENEEEEGEEYNESEDSSDEEEEEEEEESGGFSRGKIGNRKEEEDENYEGRSSSSRKRAKKSEFCVMQEMSSEMMGVLQDGGRSTWEKKQWMKRRLIHLEEQQISYQIQAFELEKKRLKWKRFSSKKEREMERAKLENERKQLENERMVLVIRQKEIELMNLHHNQHSSN